MLYIGGVAEIQAHDHQVVGIAEYREPLGTTQWTPMRVESGSVSVSPIDFLPGRTCTVRVVLTDGLLTGLTVFGSWVRLFHEITGSGRGPIRVPLGYFRVNRLTVDKFAGTVTIDGADLGACIEDRGFSSLAEGRVIAGSNVSQMITALLTGGVEGIVPFWQTFIYTGADVDYSLTTPTAQQYEDSRVEAVRELVNALKRNIFCGIDGFAAFQYRRLPQDRPAQIQLYPGGVDGLPVQDPAGNLVSLTAIEDRAGVANLAAMTYRNSADAQIRLTRAVTAGPTAVGGPFGVVVVEASSSAIDTEAEAYAALDAELARSSQMAYDFDVETAPIYGMESGDNFLVYSRDGSYVVATLLTAEIPLTTKDGRWSMRLRALSPPPDVRRWVW